MPANLIETIEIDAPPQEVWPVVSDLRRMGEWSPYTRKVIVRGDRIGLGTSMVSINRIGWKVYPMTSTVTAFDPGKRIAFRVPANRTEWSFDLEPLDAGTRTRVTELRDVSRGISAASRTLIDRVLGGEESFERDLVVGMQQTLQRIKAEVER